eukprot:6304792-Prymnesium_polylepis.1
MPRTDMARGACGRERERAEARELHTAPAPARILLARPFDPESRARESGVDTAHVWPARG